jgi:hypothetical protein
VYLGCGNSTLSGFEIVTSCPATLMTSAVLFFATACPQVATGKYSDNLTQRIERTLIRILAKTNGFLALMVAAGAAIAQSTPTQLHTTPQADPGVYSGRVKPEYPTPHEPASEQIIQMTLRRVHSR